MCTAPKAAHLLLDVLRQRLHDSLAGRITELAFVKMNLELEHSASWGKGVGGTGLAGATDFVDTYNTAARPSRSRSHCDTSDPSPCQAASPVKRVTNRPSL